VQEVALLIHREFAKSLKYARLWRVDQYNGQQVGLDQPVADGDVVELHT
jgi:ribosome-interacting GTPase 1